jgi:hypothetical protein
MGNLYLDWGLLALILAAFCVIAFHFTRLVFRTAVLVVATALALRVTWLGLAGLGHPGTYVSAFVLGGDRLARSMLAPLLPGGVTASVVVGRVGWIVLLVALLAVLACFDTWSVRREQPRVSIPRAPDAEPGLVNLADRRELTEKLRFILPAVDVRRPAAMPGSTATESLASVAAASGVQGSGLAAAVIQLAQALQARPRTYEVRVFTERCREGGKITAHGPRRRVTVEMRDARTGQSVAVHVLQPCVPRETAQKVAGYTARQIFRADPATPAWATGSLDGADLSAYLLARQTCPAGRSYPAWRACRDERRVRLERVVGQDTGAGVIGYELAGLHDLDGENVRALLLHLGNRMHYPQFWRGRYRLAISLSMLAGRMDDVTWMAGQDLARNWDALALGLSLAGLLRHLPAAEAAALAGPFPDGQDGITQARRGLSRVAGREMTACWRHHHVSILLWSALWRRRLRGASLAAVACLPGWWRHPRRRLWALEFARDIVRQRMVTLDEPAAIAARRLRQVQYRARRRLHHPEPEAAGVRLGGGRRWPRRDRELGAAAWRYGRATWQAVYNAACLHALPDATGTITQAAKLQAVGLLRLAISDPDCELDRPSERMATDPSLRALHWFPEFDKFVHAQARRDFDLSRAGDLDDEWLQEVLWEQWAAAPG